MLIANRKKIVWCTKLMRAHSDDEKAEIEGEMYNSPDLVDILAQLKATRASARDRKHAMIEEVREEARRMLGSDAAGGGGKGGAEAVDRDVAARQVLDLEALQFDGGGHFLANKSVQLPKETFRKLEKGYEEARTQHACCLLGCFDNTYQAARHTPECIVLVKGGLGVASGARACRCTSPHPSARARARSSSRSRRCRRGRSPHSRA